MYRCIYKVLVPVLISAFCAGICSGGAAYAAGDGNAAACPTSTEASPGFRAYLPDCRAFELVTPPFKDGAVVIPTTGVVAPTGAQVLYGSAGAFGGVGNLWLTPGRNPEGDVYVASRTAAGWVSTPLTPPASTFPHSLLIAASKSLDSTLWTLGVNASAFNEAIYLRGPSGSFSPIGPAVGPELATTRLNRPAEELQFAGAAADLSVSVFSIESASQTTREQAYHGLGNLWPGDTTEPSQQSLYEYSAAATSKSEPLLVGVRNSGPLRGNAEASVISMCGTSLGASPHSVYNAVSEDGETIAFTARACNTTPEVDEVYLRVGGSRTIAVSEPTPSDCGACVTAAPRSNAEFVGASADGQRVFFMTSQELLPGATTRNLYEYDRSAPGSSVTSPTGKISLVSAGGSNAEVQGVVRIASDGGRVYFVAAAVLAGPNGEHREPVAGADNLYVSVPSTSEPSRRETRFVATLLTSVEREAIASAEEAEQTQNTLIAEEVALAAAARAEREGASPSVVFATYSEAFFDAEEALVATRGPSGTLQRDEEVWKQMDLRPAQTTADGSVLAFVSSALLTPGEVGDTPHIYLYDDRSERISSASGPLSLEPGTSNVFADAPILSMPAYYAFSRPTAGQTENALTANGTDLYFTSRGRLTATASSGATNVYKYADGELTLISGGDDASASAKEPTVRLWGLSPNGEDAFFTTASRLVPQALDTQMALYDARADGGFTEPRLGQPCVAEACRGASAGAPEGAHELTSGQTPGDNASVIASHVIHPQKLSPAARLRRALQLCARLHHRRKARQRCKRAAKAAGRPVARRAAKRGRR